MSTENGKYLLNWIFGDICNAGAFAQKLPRYWSIFCGSLAEQPAFEVVLQEKPLTKVSKDAMECISGSESDVVEVFARIVSNQADFCPEKPSRLV